MNTYALSNCPTLSPETFASYKGRSRKVTATLHYSQCKRSMQRNWFPLDFCCAACFCDHSLCLSHNESHGEFFICKQRPRPINWILHVGEVVSAALACGYLAVKVALIKLTSRGKQYLLQGKWFHTTLNRTTRKGQNKCCTMTLIGSTNSTVCSSEFLSDSFWFILPRPNTWGLHAH